MLFTLDDPPAPTAAWDRRTVVASKVVPGRMSAREVGCRFAIGSESICSRVTTAVTSVLVVSTTGATPTTVSDSCTP